LRQVKFGIVGCGVISEAHINAVLHSPNSELVAVSDVREEAAKAKADQYNVEAYTDVEEMFDKSGVEAIVVGTPSGTHGEIALKAAEYGIHAIVEKPIDINLKTIDRMIETFRRKDLKLAGVFQRRTYPVYGIVRERLRRGEFGRILLADLYMKFYRKPSYYEKGVWKGTWNMDGGGALMNQGIHGVDLILWLIGGVEEVYGIYSHQARRIEADDTSLAVLKFRSGAMGVIEASTIVNPDRGIKIEIHGEKGTVEIDRDIIVGWYLTHDPEERAIDVQPPISREECESIKRIKYYGHKVLIDDFARAIIEDREPLIPGEEARRAVELIRAIYKSCDERKPIKLPLKS